MSNIYHLSEIFPVVHCQLNLAGFRLSPAIDRKLGNSLGWHFSKYFPNIVVVWEQGSFWILAKSQTQIPTQEKWKKALEQIQNKYSDKFGDRTYFIRWIDEPVPNALTIAQLAVRTLQINCHFSSDIVTNQNQIMVKRECRFWAETIEIGEREASAICFTPKTTFLYAKTLDHFLNNHPFRNEPEKLLTGLLIRDIDSNSTATIVELNGTIGGQREKLLQQASGAISREKLITAPDDEPVVSVQFGKNSHLYDYAMAALRPCIQSKTAFKFNVEYGALLKYTKIKYAERQKLLSQYKQDADKVLSSYGFEFNAKCVNSIEDPNLFWIPETKLEDTLLLFGNGVKSPKSKTLRGLSQGGVYSRHENFKDINRPIRLAILNFTSLEDKPFFVVLEQRLSQYKFKLHLTRENIKSASLEGLSEIEARAKVQTLVDEVVIVPPDLVLVFLPESDRGKDDSDGNSIYV